MLDPVKKAFSPSSFFSAFNVGMKALGRKLTIPLCHKAALEDPHSSRGWPVVVFSHGMGCNRLVYIISNFTFGSRRSQNKKPCSNDIYQGQALLATGNC